MKASVVIPTYQGADKLPAVLKALEQQTSKKFEVIVVIDGSTDNTRKILEYPFDFYSLRVVDQSNMGRAGARNAGAKIAIGDILIFYDDDILSESHSVENHIAFHTRQQGAILTGYTPQVKNVRNDFNKYRTHLSEKWMSLFPEGITRLGKNNVFMGAANCSMPKTLFKQLNGFDESLSDAEDKEFGIRAYEKNIPLFFDKQNIAWHNENLTCRKYILRLRQYARADKLVNATSSGDVTNKKFYGLKNIVYYLLAVSWLVNVIDRANILMVLPRRIRYRVYDAITFSLSQLHPEVKL